MCKRIGVPPISTIGFGLLVVSSDILVPNPPASIKTGVFDSLNKIKFFTIEYYIQ